MLGPGVVRAEDAALAAIVRSSNDAVIAKTVEGIVTAWNHGAQRLYGFTAEQTVGADIEQFIPPDWVERERERHARVAAGESESGYRCTRLHANGHDVDVVMSMSPVRSPEGDIVGIASISRPVSEQELSQSRFAALLDTAPDAMICVNGRGDIVLVNVQAREAFGYTGEELIGQRLEILLPDDVRTRHVHHRENYVSAPVARPMGSGLNLKGRRRDGTTFPVDVSLSSVEVQGEQIAIAAVRDVSIHHAIEAALRESESRLLQLTENTDTVFTLRETDPERYLYVSPAFSKLTGREAQALFTDPDVLEKMIHPDDVARVRQDVFDATHAGRVGISEHRIVRGDGTIRWVRAISTPVVNRDGRPKRVVTTTDDITEQIEAGQALADAEAAARAASAAKNEFLSRMSHELRTPLNAVLGFGQLLDRRILDPAQRDSVHHILRAGRHLLELINEVLDISRIESGQMSVSPEPVSVASIVDETTTLMQPLAAANQVDLSIVGGPTGLFVLADRQRLRQVLLNLVSNAVKYNHHGGFVRLGWEVRGEYIAISVQDDGPGVPPDLHERLFAPFDRLGAETSGVEGTGVGLTVTRGLVELMNGAVRVDSEVGAGATFTVELPLTQPPVILNGADLPNAEVPIDLVAPIASATVLYIEDNEPNVHVMESLLELRPSWRMIHAGLSRLGIEFARAHKPDLVMLDLHLPDGSGADVLTAMKSDRTLAGIPVVVLSADASPNQVRRLIAAGAHKYLTKPLDLDEVLTLLDDVAAAVATKREVTGSSGP